GDVDPNGLVVWIPSDASPDALRSVGDRFTEATGIPVSIRRPFDVAGTFEQAATSARAPDIVFASDDRLGAWARAGLVAPVDPPDGIRKDTAAVGWNAFTVGGQVYGYPFRLTAVGLIYNRDLVSTPPKTFDDVIAVDRKLRKDGRHAILWDYNNPYFTWPLLAANGGYIFKQGDEGGYDTGDTGVDADGAVKGATLLVHLIEEGVMPRGATYADAVSAFASGDVAMTINGPWSWARLSNSGIDFGVAPIPSVGGKPAKPFVGVWGAMISASSPDKVQAVAFVERYLMSEAGRKAMAGVGPPGVPASTSAFKQRADEPRIQATMVSVRNGEPAPDVPEIGRFWARMAAALQAITSSRQDVQTALEQAAERIEGNRPPARD
ncbi:MAG TPA: maltose/maltodextrin ABC transporter substrate-binding protein MalE, partial [Gammaproteobacteria bacterium]|nr:maltose/maltodextrin ABC transporter substrate-binding protein MalE [Gammaproteobacteria bacterium]